MFFMNIKIYSDQTLFHPLVRIDFRKAGELAEERRSIAARRHAKLPFGTSALGFGSPPTARIQAETVPATRKAAE
jgi:hypothetical protein